MPYNAVAINRTALKDARLRRGWSLRALSDATKDVTGHRVDASNISRYERGPLQPFPRTLKALADALGMSVDDLRGEDEEQEPEAVTESSAA